jgi:hypothetical protein
MVKPMIPTRDIELISAYLDQQLKSKELARLEIRLKNEPALQDMLQSLRRTRLMLRSLPPRKAPRNFTLTPAMVGATRPARTYQPVFGVVSAVAIMLLLFVFIGDLVTLPGYVGMFPVSQAPSASEEISAEQFAVDSGEDALVFPTDQPTQSADPMLAAPAAQKAQPTEEGIVGIFGEVPPEATEDARMMEEPAPPALDALPQAGESQAFDIQEAPTPSSTPTQELTSTLEVMAAPTEALAMAPESEGESMPLLPGAEEPSLLTSHTGQDDQRSDLWVQLVFWMVELLLVVVAVGAGGVAFYTWYRSKV